MLRKSWLDFQRYAKTIEALAKNDFLIKKTVYITNYLLKEKCTNENNIHFRRT